VFCGLGQRKAVKEERDRFREMTWCCWCSGLGLRGSVAVGRRRGRTGGGTGASSTLQSGCSGGGNGNWFA
jgi:hypothetical protein